MEPELVPTRGRAKYVDDGYSYTFDKESKCGQNKFWRCTRKIDGCKARLHTCVRTDQVLSRFNEHIHGSDPGLIQAQVVTNEMKRRAVETVETPAQIMANVMAGTSEAVLGQLPHRDARRKVIQRKRNTVRAIPPSPKDLLSLEIPEDYKYYVVSQQEKILFLLGDTGKAADRILLFGREDAQEWSSFMKNIYMDGTFKLASPLFSQVFVILAERDGYVFPVLYALLADKRQETYSRLFMLIKSVRPDFKPESVQSDYEMAILNSIAEQFSEAEIRGCLFHLSKNIKKKLGKEHLLSQYNNDPEYALKARMIVSLAFVPIDDLSQAVIYDYLPVTLQRILEWFEDNYIGHLQRNGTRLDPLFSSKVWSVYNRVLLGQNRTNNFAEAAHRTLQRELDVEHPSIWKFIDGLRIVQESRDTHYAGFLRGIPPPYKRRKYQDADARIAENVRRFADRTIIEYLTGIAQNFLLN